MAYNNYGYTGYNPYYHSQSQDQNSTQSPATHGQAYQNSSNPYSQYPQYNANQYAHQPSDRTHQQYQTKSSIENPGFQSSYGYPQQQYTTSTSRNDTSTGYPTYATSSQTSNAAYPYNTQSTLDQNNKAFQDTTALGNLAYASTLNARSASTINNVSTSSQLYQQQQQQQSQQPQPQQQQPQAQQQQQHVQQPQQTQQTQSSSSILPNPTHQQPYAQPNSQKTHATPQMSQQPLYRSNVANQQRVAPAATQIRRSPSLPVKQQSISQQGSTKVMSPHSSIMGPTSTRPSIQSNAHQISTIMNQNQDLTTTKVQQAPPSQIHTQVQNHVQLDERSPANAMQSPAIAEVQQPATIDPTAIFDHGEWARKRRVQEEAEAAKRIKEHKIPAPIQPPPPVAQPIQMTQAPIPQQSTPKTSTPDQSKSLKQKEPIPEDEIRAEMRAFAEKLRVWKSRDPSGNVDEMWRQTLQGTNNSFLLGPRISSQTPQLSRVTVPGKSTPKLDTSAVSPGFDDSVALGSPFQGSGGDDLPDLGKFPAMRRRTRADKGVSRSAKAGQVAAARAITQSSPPASASHLVKATPLATATPIDAGAESMRRAMQAFHQTPTPATPDPSTPVTQPKVKTQVTVWPEDKKPILSESAKIFLENQPANKGKHIAAEEILNMLNQNPSYDQLCIMLANRGFAVPRAAFAQELLEIVPSGSSRSSTMATNADDTPAKKPRGRPKKTSIATPIDSPVVPQPTNGAPMGWSNNLPQSGMPMSDGKANDLANGDGAEYAPFYEKMRLISGQSPAQPQNTPPQLQPGKKRNIGELGKSVEVNGALMGKKQQFDRPGVVKNQRDPRPK